MIRRLLASAALALLAAAAPLRPRTVDPTSQAKRPKGMFLRALELTRPAAVICLVDTGVNETPDTTPSSDGWHFSA